METPVRMKYSSTRGGINDASFEEALFSGFLTDGGLFLPNTIPQLTTDTLKSWSSLSFVDLAKKIFPYFTGDEIPSADLNDLIDKAFASFSSPSVVKLQRLDNGLNILELFLGRTLAFKDLALSVVGQMFEYFLNKREKYVTIVVGTSGDTGSAAIEAVRGLKWVDLIVVLPRGRCSKVQELQMTTVLDSNIHVYRFDGTSDDMDVEMKKLFMNEDFVATHNLTAINSINWARIMAQTVHYFYAYFQMRPDCDGQVEIAIPTGACGNVTAGCIAVKMGLPVKFVCCVNANDAVARAFTDGDISSRTVIPSLAPAMDIQMAYNLERIFHIFSDRNVKFVKDTLDEFETKGKAQLPKDFVEKIQKLIQTYVVDDDGIKQGMARCWKENQYLLCPHTATAAKYHFDMLDKGIPCPHRVCIATASPAKFEETVLQAGLEPQPTEAIKKLPSMKTKYVDISLDEYFKAIHDKVIQITQKRTA